MMSFVFGQVIWECFLTDAITFYSSPVIYRTYSSGLTFPSIEEPMQAQAHTMQYQQSVKNPKHDQAGQFSDPSFLLHNQFGLFPPLIQLLWKIRQGFHTFSHNARLNLEATSENSLVLSD
jgi:hypothetical protein